jgi:phage shock protein A
MSVQLTQLEDRVKQTEAELQKRSSQVEELTATVADLKLQLKRAQAELVAVSESTNNRATFSALNQHSPGGSGSGTVAPLASTSSISAAAAATEDLAAAAEGTAKLRKELALSRQLLADIMKKYEQLRLTSQQQQQQLANRRGGGGSKTLGTGSDKPADLSAALERIEAVETERNALDQGFVELTQHLVDVRLALMSNKEEIEQLKAEVRDGGKKLAEEKLKRIELQKKLTRFEVRAASG